MSGFMGVGVQCRRAAFDGDFIDQIGLVTGPEAVVNVDDGYARSTAIEHGEQGGNAAEAGTVTDAGGDGNDRTRNQSTHHAGQCAFHAGSDDGHIGPE